VAHLRPQREQLKPRKNFTLGPKPYVNSRRHVAIALFPAHCPVSLRSWLSCRTKSRQESGT